MIDEEKETEGRAWVAMLVIWLRVPIRWALWLWDLVTGR